METYLSQRVASRSRVEVERETRTIFSSPSWQDRDGEFLYFEIGYHKSITNTYTVEAGVN
jgi:hypothetical protein